MSTIHPSADMSTAFERPRGRAADSGGGMRGHMRAEQFEIELDSSLLSDAAEELSLFHAEKAESKHVGERRKELGRTRSLMNSDAIESYIEDAEEEEGSTKLLDFVQRVMKGQGNPGLQAQQMFRRPATQYLALQYALQKGEGEGASEQLLEFLRDAIDELELDSGPSIRADINTIDVAKEGRTSSGRTEQFQSTYVDLVLGHATLAATLHMVLDEFGETGLVAGLERLQRALGLDLAAARPSTDVAHLNSLVQDLYHLGVANTVLEGCGDLLAELSQRHGIEAKMVPVALMKNLVELSRETWVSPDRVGSLSNEAGAGEVEPQIHFLTGIKRLIREMPPQIFVDGDQRQNVLAAAQGALDIAIDREGE